MLDGYLAAALSYLLLRQNDAVGLVTFDEAPLAMVPARSVRRQLFQVLKVLDDLPAGRGTREVIVIDARAVATGPLAERVKRLGIQVRAGRAVKRRPPRGARCG